MCSHSDSQLFEVKAANDNENTILKVIKTDGLSCDTVDEYVLFFQLFLSFSIKCVLLKPIILP